MAIDLATLTRDARLNAIETEIGTAPVLTIRTGAPPNTCADADSGSVLASFSLPSDWMDVATGGTKSKSATAWTGTASGAGTAGHFRLYATGGTVCKMQGTCAASAADMILDNVVLAIGQSFTVTSFVLTDGNAT